MPTTALLYTLNFQQILAIGASKSWFFHQMDNAFLHGILNKEVYMRVPQGYLTEPHNLNLVCKLNKSIYELKQASQTWFTKLQDVIAQLGFKQCKSDYSVFVQQSKDTTTVILAYVNDLLIAGDNLNTITSLKEQL